MALTKVTGQVIKNTTDVTVGVLTVTNTLAVGGTVSIGGTLTYEDVTNVDAVGLITARNGIVVGSGITLSKDGDGFFTGVTTTGSLVSSGAISGTTGTFSGDVDIADKIVHTGDTDTAIRFADADTITAETGGSERVRITSDGSFSVGTTSPDSALHVYKQINDRTARFQRLSGQHLDITQTGGINSFLSTGKNFEIGTTDSQDMIFDTGGSERIRITSAGLVGINETPTISQFQVKTAQLGGTSGNTQEVLRLHSPDVSNTTSYRFTNYRVSDGTSHSSSELRFRRHVDVTDMGFFGLGDGYVNFGYGTAEKARITSAGKVGISTITPNAKLHVLANDEPGILIEDDNNNNAAPYLEIIGKRGDGNHHQSFSGQIFLSRNRTEQKINDDLKLGTILFGGNHTNASKSNIAYPASISAVSSGDFNSVTDMPTDLVFYTGSTGRTPKTPNVSSGTERMRINKDGIITKPYTPSFFATLDESGDHTTNQGVRIPWNITKHNTGSHYDTSNYYFVAPVNGDYYFFCQLWAKNGTSNARFHFHFEDASNSYAGDNITQNGMHANSLNRNDVSLTASVVYHMDAGDRMSVRPDNTNLTYYTAGNSDPHSYWCGYLIG